MTLEERYEITWRCEKDIGFRNDCIRFMLSPEGDPFFINAFVYTWDTRNDPLTGDPIGTIPFLLWKRQEEMALEVAYAIDKGKKLLIKKGRDVGASWVVVSCIAKRFLLVPDFSFLMGTYIEDLLDAPEEPDSLFWKFDQLLLTLPDWLYPHGGIKTVWAKRSNPAMGTYVSGRAPTARFGRSGRKTGLFYDEWAFWQYGRAAWRSGGGTSPCQIACSTPNGDDVDNHFEEAFYQKGDFRHVHIPNFEIGWMDDERKNMTARDPMTGETFYPWKRAMVGIPELNILGEMPPEDFAQEYDGDFKGARVGRIYKEQFRYVRVGDYPFDPSLPTYTAWDFGLGDECVILFIQFDARARRYRLVDAVEYSGHIIDWYAPFVKGASETEVLVYDKEYGPTEKAIIRSRNNWRTPSRMYDGKVTHEVRYEAHYGDPSGKNRSQTDGKSVKSVLYENHRIRIDMKDSNYGRSLAGRIIESRRIIRHLDVNKGSARAMTAWERIQNYSWDKNGKDHNHDINSHTATALQYFAVNERHGKDLGEVTTMEEGSTRGQLQDPVQFAVSGYPSLSEMKKLWGIHTQEVAKIEAILQVPGVNRKERTRLSALSALFMGRDPSEISGVLSEIQGRVTDQVGRNLQVFDERQAGLEMRKGLRARAIGRGTSKEKRRNKTGYGY